MQSVVDSHQTKNDTQKCQTKIGSFSYRFFGVRTRRKREATRSRRVARQANSQSVISWERPSGRAKAIPSTLLLDREMLSFAFVIEDRFPVSADGPMERFGGLDQQRTRAGLILREYPERLREFGILTRIGGLTH